MSIYDVDIEEQLQEELLLCQARIARLQDIEAVCRSEFTQTQEREDQIQRHLALLHESRRLNPKALEYQPPTSDTWATNRYD